MATFTISLILTSCGNNAKIRPQQKKPQTRQEYTSAYVCPMHCKNSGSYQPAKCPTCGMNYVKNSEQTKTEIIMTDMRQMTDMTDMKDITTKHTSPEKYYIYAFINR